MCEDEVKNLSFGYEVMDAMNCEMLYEMECEIWEISASLWYHELMDVSVVS